MEHVNPADDAFKMGMDRFNALLTWRGVPGPDGMTKSGEAWRRCLAMTSDVYNDYGAALDKQTNLIMAASGRLATSVRAAFESRNPADFAGVQMQALAALFECGTTREWGEFIRKSAERFSACANETASGWQKACGAGGQPENKAA